ncbi:MAG: tyrosine-type recombinase/integrase, partial [Anaerolineales bacterium]
KMSTLFVAFEDFILSREAALCSPETIDFYRRMLKPFLTLANGSPPSNRMVREFLSTVTQRGVSSATVHAHARAVRAFLRFAYEEGWTEEPLTVRMPRVEQKRMEVLSREDARKVLSVCGTRDRALVPTLIDSGLRRGEALALDWNDIDLRTGTVHVRRGKGSKARVTYFGAKTRRALLRWGGGQRRSAIFPLTASGGTTLMARLSQKSRVHITFHKCRRTFATWALMWRFKPKRASPQ